MANWALWARRWARQGGVGVAVFSILGVVVPTADAADDPQPSPLFQQSLTSSVAPV